MLNQLISIMLSIVAAIRRLWQRFTRGPVPVRIPVRAHYSLFSLPVTDQRSPADATRLRERW